MTAFKEQRLRPEVWANALEKHTGDIWSIFADQLRPLDFAYLYLSSSVAANRNYYSNMSAADSLLRLPPAQAAENMSSILALWQDAEKTWSVDQLRQLQKTVGYIFSIFSLPSHQLGPQDKINTLTGLTKNPDGFIGFLAEIYAQSANFRPDPKRGKVVKKGESLWTDFFLTFERVLQEENQESALNKLYTQTIIKLLAGSPPNHLLAAELQASTTTYQDRIATALLLPTANNLAWDEAWNIAANAMGGSKITPALHSTIIQFIQAVREKGGIGHAWGNRSLHPYYTDIIANRLPNASHPAYEPASALGRVAAHLDLYQLTENPGNLENAGDMSSTIKKREEMIAALGLIWQTGKSHTDLLSLLVAAAGQPNTHQLFIRLLDDVLVTGDQDMLTAYGNLFNDKLTSESGPIDYQTLVQTSQTIKIARCHLAASRLELSQLKNWLDYVVVDPDRYELIRDRKTITNIQTDLRAHAVSAHSLRHPGKLLRSLATF